MCRRVDDRPSTARPSGIPSVDPFGPALLSRSTTGSRRGPQRPVFVTELRSFFGGGDRQEGGVME